MSDNVTSLPKPRRKEAKPPPLKVVHDHGGCRHEHIEICEKEAEAKCADCGKMLNPIWVLARIAEDDHKLTDRWAKMKAEVQLMDARTKTQCVHCNKFTPLRSRAKVSDLFMLAEKIKRDEL